MNMSTFHFDRAPLTEDKDHVGDLCHVPLPDRTVRSCGTIAHRLQFACVDSGYEIIFVLKTILR